MVTILVKEQVIFLVIAENREIPVTIIVTLVTIFSPEMVAFQVNHRKRWKNGERKGDVLDEC